MITADILVDWLRARASTVGMLVAVEDLEDMVGVALARVGFVASNEDTRAVPLMTALGAKTPNERRKERGGTPGPVEEIDPVAYFDPFNAASVAVPEWPDRTAQALDDALPPISIPPVPSHVTGGADKVAHGFTTGGSDAVPAGFTTGGTEQTAPADVPTEKPAAYVAPDPVSYGSTDTGSSGGGGYDGGGSSGGGGGIE